MASGALEASGRKGALVVASPPPLAFWKRDIYWRTADRYGIASFVPGVGGNVDVTGSPTGMDDPRIDSWTKTDPAARAFLRSEEHTSELQSLMRISYAVFCLKKKN